VPDRGPRRYRSGPTEREESRPVLGTAAVAIAVLVGVAAVRGFVGGTPSVTTRAGTAGLAAAPATPTPSAVTSSEATGSAPAASPSVSSAALASSGPLAADRAAGLRSRTVPQRGTGSLAVVGGRVAAPGPGRVVRVRVEVERGLDVDRQAFARFVMATLNDERSWSHGGARSFARTDRTAAFRMVLASPQTTAELCRPLVTYGRLSCRTADMAVLTLYRWVNAIPGYRSNATGYRRYVVNHEMGHLLGLGHQPCPGAGEPAPVMMQQTKGLTGCRPNPWSFP
jgi:hypothetical protein